MTVTLRARYLNNNDQFSHSDYYGALVEYIGENALRTLLPFSKTSTEWRELVANDPHLNNVQLYRWDMADSRVRRLLRASDDLREITGPGGWSLSDSVCVLKETARRLSQSDRDI